MNWIKWARGKPDFAPNDTVSDEHRKPIPLSRATLAILFAVLVLSAEAALYFSQRKDEIPLYIQDFRLTVKRTETFKDRQLDKDLCHAHKLETGRASMTAVFAFCNKLKKSESGALTGDLDVQFTVNEYAQKVAVSSRGRGSSTVTKAESITSFVIMVPDEKEHLVVPFEAEDDLNITEAVRMIEGYLKERECKNIVRKPDGLFEVEECTQAVDVFKLTEFVLGFIDFDHSAGGVGGDTRGIIGRENDGGIVRLNTKEDKGPILGTVEQMKIRDEGLLGLTAALLIIAILIYFCVPNDTTEVVAFLMREKTSQDPYIPAYAMNDESIHVVLGNDEEDQGKLVHRTTHHDPGRDSLEFVPDNKT